MSRVKGNGFLRSRNGTLLETDLRSSLLSPEVVSGFLRRGDSRRVLDPRLLRKDWKWGFFSQIFRRYRSACIFRQILVVRLNDFVENNNAHKFNLVRKGGDGWGGGGGSKRLCCRGFRVSVLVLICVPVGPVPDDRTHSLVSVREPRPQVNV